MSIFFDLNAAKLSVECCFSAGNRGTNWMKPECFFEDGVQIFQGSNLVIGWILQLVMLLKLKRNKPGFRKLAQFRRAISPEFPIVLPDGRP